MIDLNNTPAKQILGRGVNSVFSVDLGGQEYFFKTCSEVEGVLSNEDIAEVFASYFLERVGCKDFVKYSFARLGNRLGSISKSFVTQDTERVFTYKDIRMFCYANSELGEIVDLDTKFESEVVERVYQKFEDARTNFNCLYSVNDVALALQDFSKDYGFAVDIEKTKQKLQEMAVYDYFLGNDDRNPNNISFLLQKTPQGKELVTAPIFDNDSAFSNRRWFRLLGLSDNAPCAQEYSNNNILKSGGMLATDILDLGKHNSSIASIIQNCRGVDIAEMLKNFEKSEDITLDVEIKQQIIDDFSKSIWKLNDVERRLSKHINKTKGEGVNVSNQELDISKR